MTRGSPAAFDQHAPLAIGVPSPDSANHVWSSNWDGRFQANARYEANGWGTRPGRRSASTGDSTVCIAVSSASVPDRNPTRRTRYPAVPPTPPVFASRAADVT